MPNWELSAVDRKKQVNGTYHRSQYSRSRSQPSGVFATARCKACCLIEFAGALLFLCAQPLFGQPGFICVTSVYIHLQVNSDLALASLFTHLCRRAWEADSTLALVAFGFLLAVFVSGFVVSAFKTVRAFSVSRSAGSHATH